MKFFSWALALQMGGCLAAVLSKPMTRASGTGRYVTAHYIAGNAASYSTADWQDDMTRAQNVGIDAFGLDIAANDPNTLKTLATAFQAAESLSGRKIQLFLIFDYLAWGAWDAGKVMNLINQYKSSAAYFKYLNRPVVSTFEGVSNINDWGNIKSSTNCYFMPDWSSQGPAGVSKNLNIIDGFASWNAWPDGPANLTTDLDSAYIGSLQGKSYMMPVSPWFYTDLPAYGKNWLWHSDSIWHYRWTQANTLGPTFVQVISWNDYGESHYIGPIRPSGVVSGATYVDSAHPHTAWTTLLPYYIAAYKSMSGKGDQNPYLTSGPTGSDQEQLVYWYKSTTTYAGSTDGTTGNNPSYQTTYPPAQLSSDRIFFTVNLKSPANIVVTIGANSNGVGGVSQTVLAGSKGITHLSVPIPSNTGGSVRFTVTRSGTTAFVVKGSSNILTSASKVNWNAVVGSR